jgi:hypothetical protein
MRSVSQLQSDEVTLQRALLAFVLGVFPERLTLDELVLELASDWCDFAGRDAIGNAVRGLGGAGLVHRESRFVLPTHSCLKARELLVV